jgi:FkbM family methyltransferase
MRKIAMLSDVSSLIFDVGSHEGMDTAYYLHVGAKVVAIDADPRMTERLETRFATAVRDGRLELVNRAVAEQRGQHLQFYLSENSWWNSLYSEVADRQGSHSETITVETTTLSALIQDYGLPDYCKIDIEGLDATAVRTLDKSVAPQFISVETECSGDAGTSDPLDTLRALTERGYTGFKLIEQCSLRELRHGEPFFHRHRAWSWRIRQQIHRRLRITRLQPHYRDRQALVAKHGHFFPSGSTGPFGYQLPGDWLDAETAERTLQYHRTDYFKTPRAVPWGFWCDWHATR